MIVREISTILIRKKYFLHIKHMDKAQDLSVILFAIKKYSFYISFNFYQINMTFSTIHEVEVKKKKIELCVSSLE